MLSNDSVADMHWLVQKHSLAHRSRKHGRRRGCISSGNLVVQPFELYHELWKRNISGLKYRGNIINLAYRGSGKFIEKVLVNNDNYSSRYFTIPEGLNQPVINIEAVLSDRPVPPMLYSVRTNNAYTIRRCGYDEKAGIFNIDMDKLPDENFNCTFTVRSNGKKKI